MATTVNEGMSSMTSSWAAIKAKWASLKRSWSEPASDALQLPRVVITGQGMSLDRLPVQRTDPDAHSEGSSKSLTSAPPIGASSESQASFARPTAIARTALTRTPAGSHIPTEATRVLSATAGIPAQVSSTTVSRPVATGMTERFGASFAQPLARTQASSTMWSRPPVPGARERFGGSSAQPLPRPQVQPHIDVALADLPREGTEDLAEAFNLQLGFLGHFHDLQELATKGPPKALAKLRMIQEQGSRDRQAASSQAADPGAFGVWHSVDNVL
eukprot:g29626.t1